MIPQKPLSDLAAVILARAEELAQPKPSELVIATCDMFMVAATREASLSPSFIEATQPKEKK